MTKEKILESAFHEFSEKGYFATNPESITKQIPINRVVFYSYFKNKNAVLIDLIRELIDELSGLVLDKKVHKQWLNASSFSDFQEPFLFLTEVLCSCSGLLKAFMQGMTADKELRGLYDEICAGFSKVFEDKIRSLQHAGQFQGCDPHTLSRIMVITLLMSIFTYSIGIIECTPRQLAKNLALFCHAVLYFDGKENRRVNTSGPKSEKSRKTRNAILTAAGKAFDMYGYKNVTIDRIADVAGCSRGTIYLYFKSKKDIVRELEKKSFGLSDFSTEKGISPLKTDAKFSENNQPAKKSKMTKRQKTYQKILVEAKKALAANGYHETTIEHIARMAGVSRSTMYLYFKKKDEILQCLLQEMLENIDPAELAVILADIDTTSIDDLMRLNNIVIEIFEHYAMVNWALLQATFYSEALTRYFKDLYHQFSLPVNKTIEDLKKQGKCGGVKTEIASRIIITCICYSASMYTAGIIPCSKNELQLSLAKVSTRFLNYIPARH